MKKMLLALAPAIAALFLASCAGTVPAETKRANLFITDSMQTGFDQVWIAIRSVEFVQSDGATVVAFDRSAAEAMQVDLLALQDSVGKKFAHLSGFDIPVGTYLSAKITVSSDLMVYPNGATSGIPATFSGSTPGGVAVLALTFDNPQTVTDSANLVVDFDLAKWVFSNNKVSTSGSYLALVSAMDSQFLDTKRHVQTEHAGTVSELSTSSAKHRFTLTNGTEVLRVTLCECTQIFRSDGSAGVEISNGQELEVTGSYDPAGKVFNATLVIIKVNESEKLSKVQGRVMAYDTLAGTVTLEVRGAKGFLPNTSTVTILVDSNTVSFFSSGITTRDGFFSRLEAYQSFVYARGTWDASTSTLSAKGVGIILPANSI